MHINLVVTYFNASIYEMQFVVCWSPFFNFFCKCSHVSPCLFVLQLVHFRCMCHCHILINSFVRLQVKKVPLCSLLIPLLIVLNFNEQKAHLHFIFLFYVQFITFECLRLQSKSWSRCLSFDASHGKACATMVLIIPTLHFTYTDYCRCSLTHPKLLDAQLRV